MGAVIHKIKRGDVVIVGVSYSPSDGSKDLSLATISSLAKTQSGKPVGSIPLNPVDLENGLYELILDTKDWPIGRILFDVRYTWSPSNSISSEIVVVDIIESITPRE